MHPHNGQTYVDVAPQCSVSIQKEKHVINKFLEYIDNLENSNYCVQMVENDITAAHNGKKVVYASESLLEGAEQIGFDNGKI